MTSEALILIGSALIQLLFSYIPGLKGWVDKPERSVEWKRGFFALVSLVVAVGAFAVSCGGFGEQLGVQVLCSSAGALGLGQAYVLALIAQQGTYQITKG